MSYTQLKAALEHKSTGMIPHREFFMNINARDRFLPELKSMSAREAILREIEFFDNMKMVEPCWETKKKTIEYGANYIITESETGTKTYTQYDPFFYHVIDYPVKEKSDLKNIRLPDPDEAERYRHIEEDIEFFGKRDFWIESKEVRGSGFFSGVWYNLRSIDNFLMDMMEDRLFAHDMIELVGDHRLKVAENLLKRGVHSICVNDDMGSTSAPFFSKEMYEEYFFPWHKRMAELCHKYGAFFHIHSHGYIMPLIDSVIATGVDILDPVGPTDRMNLKEVKEKYGGRIVVMGGLSKRIALMEQEEIEEHIREAFETGSKGGGFISMNEGGIPPDISEENLKFYLKTIRKYSEKYGNGQT